MKKFVLIVAILSLTGCNLNPDGNPLDKHAISHCKSLGGTKIYKNVIDFECYDENNVLLEKWHHPKYNNIAKAIEIQ